MRDDPLLFEFFKFLNYFPYFLSLKYPWVSLSKNGSVSHSPPQDRKF